MNVAVLITGRNHLLMMVLIVFTERAIVDLPVLYLLVMILVVKCFVVLGSVLDCVCMVLIEVAIRLAKLDTFSDIGK